MTTRGRVRSPGSLAALFAGLGLVVALAGCERPPVESLQGGFRGTGMDEMINPRIDSVKAAKNTIPAPLPAAVGEGPSAATVYQNVQVLKDLNVGQFTRVMLAMTQWVAPPDQSCNYCHAANMASDERYTKVVARRMLQMVRHLNTDWKDHVGKTGVTCYTCHRGNAVPQYVWFKNPGQSERMGNTASMAGNDSVSTAVSYASLPYDPFSTYLIGNNEIRVISKDALPDGNRASTRGTEMTYALMTHMSTSLGVNCTYCHNTRSFAVWDTSTPKRTTAWYGIRMVRNLNTDYLIPLTDTFPNHRLGVLGDVAKVNCTTCHQGVFKPLYGESMLKDYPELAGELKPAEAPAAAPPATASTGGAPATVASR
jgi:photosynthetic reaction center cytochrome c subunit